MVAKLTYYERWIVAFANILFRKAILTPVELALKMDEVAARWRVETCAPGRTARPARNRWYNPGPGPDALGRIPASPWLAKRPAAPAGRDQRPHVVA